MTPFLQWKRTDPRRLWRALRWVAAASLVLGVAVPLVLAGAVAWQAMLALVLGLWVAGSHLLDLVRRLRLGGRRVPLAYWGMTAAHFGFAVTLIGVAMTSVLSIERDARMSPGQTLEVGPLALRLDGVNEVRGPNFVASRAEFVVRERGAEYQLHPEKRRYLARADNVMTEAAIDAGFTRDVYVSLGEPLANGDWAVRIQYKPLVRWIWLGGLLMAAGGVLAVLDARYRRLRRRLDAREAAPAVATAAGGGG